MHQGVSYRSANIYRRVDAFIPVIVLFAVFVSANYDSISAGVEHFFSLRIKVENFLKIGFLALCWPRIYQACGVYENPGRMTRSEEFLKVLRACSIGSLLLAFLPLLNNTNAFQVRHIPWFGLGTLLMTDLSHSIIRHFLNSATPHKGHPRKLIIVGSSPRASKLYMQLCSSIRSEYEFLGFVDSDPPANMPDFIRRRLIGGLSDLESILCTRIVDEVLITLPIKSQYNRIEEVIRLCERVGVEAKYNYDIFRTELAQPRFEFNQVPLLSMSLIEPNFQRVIKRVIDICCSLAGILLLSPLMLLIAIAIRLTSEGPAIYVQERYGQNKRLFRMYKFRTMVRNADKLQAELEKLNEVDGPVFKIRNDPRITRIGRFLRRSSLDELPQLFNVLRGDMSLVGPRPLPLRDVSRFDQSLLMRRFCVPPGLTCLWQINGRSEIGGSHLLQLDLEYIDRWSLQLDFKILAKTLSVVLKGTGAV